MSKPTSGVKLAIFDLDNTLSESRQKISKSMSDTLGKLLAVKDVAIISGGTFKQLDYQVLSELPADALLEHMTLLPESGSSCLEYKGEWKLAYSFGLSDAEKTQITKAVDQVLDIERPDIYNEPLIEDKGGQMTYSPVGVNTPPEIKATYDPSHHKREKIADALRKLLPDFEIGIGGASSIDINKHGMNKSFGVRKILELKGLRPEEAIFVGDALYEGGNDNPVRSTDVPCIQVSGPMETEQVIESWLE